MDKQVKQQAMARLAKAEGHLRKVREMVEEDAYCPDVIHQSKAVQAALKKVDELILDGHMHSCVFSQFQGTKSTKDKLINEIMEVFKYNDK